MWITWKSQSSLVLFAGGEQAVAYVTFLAMHNLLVAIRGDGSARVHTIDAKGTIRVGIGKG